jgi:hypothetical protein
MTDVDFWPTKPIAGSEEPAVPFEQAETGGADNLMDDLAAVYGDHAFLQAECMGLETFASEDACVGHNPMIDSSFTVHSASERLFKNQPGNARQHANIKDILASYQEGQDMGQAVEMSMNIPCGSIGGRHYYGFQEKAGAPCANQGDGEARATQAGGSGAPMAQDRVTHTPQAALQNRTPQTGTPLARTPSAVVA